MSLNLDKNLWEWASQIARDHDEDFLRVCANLFEDAITGKLVTSPPLSVSRRNRLRSIDVVGKTRAGQRFWIADDPQYPGYWAKGIILTEAEVGRWLVAKGSVLGANGSTPIPLAQPNSDAVSKTHRNRRRDEKRPEIAAAVAALMGTPDWQSSSDKKRCKLVEDHLDKPKGWCSPRTLSRVVAGRSA